jgi:hypothetical protein
MKRGEQLSDFIDEERRRDHDHGVPRRACLKVRADDPEMTLATFAARVALFLSPRLKSALDNSVGLQASVPGVMQEIGDQIDYRCRIILP